MTLKSKYRDDIFRLRQENPDMTMTQIAELLGCSVSLVSTFLLGAPKRRHVRERERERHLANPEISKQKYKRNTLYYKIVHFSREYIKGGNGPYGAPTFTKEQLLSKNSGICYLTGRSLDLSDSSSYRLDHIIPKSKGGDNSLDNCELTCTQANTAKNDMSLDEFIKLCKDVLEHNGYTVTR